MICVCEVESVPDVEQIAAKMNLESKNNLEICQIAFKEQLEKSGSEFLPIFWHKIVAISSVICDDYGNFIKVGNFGKQGGEKEILEDFLGFINRKEPRLVSFNGRGFDIPVIMLRAMKYNLCAFGYYESENAAKTKSKWKNYRMRYSEKWHTDLLDSLGHFGSVRNLNLDGVCKMLGIVGKYDVSGSDVYRLYYQDNDIDKINQYCQSDVLNTYWVYLKYAILKGELSIEDYAGILEKWSENLPKDMEYSKNFMQNIKQELAGLDIL